MVRNIPGNGPAACARCAFWHKHEDSAITGDCRRRAPRPLIDPKHEEDGLAFVVWPTTVDDEWCGEFERE